MLCIGEQHKASRLIQLSEHKGNQGLVAGMPLALTVRWTRSRRCPSRSLPANTCRGWRPATCPPPLPLGRPLRGPSWRALCGQEHSAEGHSQFHRAEAKKVRISLAFARGALGGEAQPAPASTGSKSESLGSESECKSGTAQRHKDHFYKAQPKGGWRKGEGSGENRTGGEGGCGAVRERERNKGASRIGGQREEEGGYRKKGRDAQQ